MRARVGGPITMQGVRCPNQERLATEVLLAAASAMLLVSLGFLRGQRRLDGLMSTLQTYAHHHDLSEMWHKRRSCLGVCSRRGGLLLALEP